jgi:thiol-disulfide isomerase/thioredoxin
LKIPAATGKKGQGKKVKGTVSAEAELSSKLASAGSKLVVVKFFSNGCGHCLEFAPEFDVIASEYPVSFFLNYLC